MTTMTRRQLFDLVWSKPMRDAAAEAGISDVGLKKVCVRHRVPIPPQGYWNKVHAGRAPHKAIFREVNEPTLNRVEIRGSGYNLPPEVKKVLIDAKVREKQPDKRIDVALTAPPILPAAVRLAASLKKGKTDEKGLAFAADPKLFLVRVAPEHIDRTVSIVEALLVAAADRGFVAITGAEHLTMVVEGESIVLSLKETTKRVPHVRTQEELDRAERRERASYLKNWDLYRRLYQPEPQWDYLATGQLFLEIEGQEYLSVRTRWSDTKTRKLENLLNDVLAGLVAYSAARKERKAEHERRERNWKRREQRAARAKARAELEKARVDFLERRLIAFEEAGRLNRFLGRLISASPGPERPPRFQAFVHWAEQRAQQLKHHCSAEGLQEGLAENSLFGPRPRPPADDGFEED